MKSAAAVVGALNWKTTLAIGVVVIGVAGFAFYLLKKAPGAAADAVGDVAVKAGQGLDAIERTVSDPSNRANRIANALASPILGTNDYTGKPNTIGSALEEAGRWGRDTFGVFW